MSKEQGLFKQIGGILKDTVNPAFSELAGATEKLKVEWNEMKTAIINGIGLEKVQRKGRNGFRTAHLDKFAYFLKKVDESYGYPAGYPANFPPSCFDRKEMQFLNEQRKTKAVLKRQRKNKLRLLNQVKTDNGYYLARGRALTA